MNTRWPGLSQTLPKIPSEFAAELLFLKLWTHQARIPLQNITGTWHGTNDSQKVRPGKGWDISTQCHCEKIKDPGKL